MDAGAFSNSEVVKSAEGLKLLLVDCTKVGQEQDNLMKKYNVRGYPSVIYCDSKGEKVGEMPGRSPGAVAKSFKQLAEKHTLALPWVDKIEMGMEKAKEAKKPMILWVTDKKQPASKVLEGTFFAEGVREQLKECVLVRVEFDRKNEDLKKIGCSRGPMLLVLNPSSENPNKPVERLRKWKSPEQLGKKLEKAMKKFEKAMK